MRISAILLMVLLLGSCYNDKEVFLYPETQCTSPPSPSYKADIAPVLAQFCNSCHSGGFPSGAIALDTYTEVKKYADNGKLIGSIVWASGYSPMPKNGNKLSACNLGKIQAWVTAGALNN